jgi:hypothetical protein
VNSGENLDVANHILQAEARGKKIAATPKKAKPVRSSERRSASIERIFTKRKSDEENSQVKQLKARLNELKEREQQLRTSTCCEVSEFGPPPPPLPPPPPPPASWSKYATSLPGLENLPSSDGNKKILGPRLICVSGHDILNLRAGLRKVGTALLTPKAPENPEEPAPKEGLFDSITQRRDAFAPDNDSDESDEGSESSEF